MVALLERRGHYRKKVDLPGKITDERKNAALVKVRDISKRGLLLQVVSPKTFEVGESLTVLFELDDPQHTKIEEKIIIRKMLPPNLLGVEFDGPEILTGPPHKAIGIYLRK